MPIYTNAVTTYFLQMKREENTYIYKCRDCKFSQIKRKQTTKKTKKRKRKTKNKKANFDYLNLNG